LIFAQLNRYARTHHVFSADDRQGASVAHADLLRAMIVHSSAESLELYANAAPKQSPPMNAEFAELCREFPQRQMRLRSLDDLAAIESNPRRVFYVSGSFISPLAQVRQNFAKRFPICAFSHALDTPIASLFLPAALLMAKPCDTIITSSAAGKIVISRLIEGSEELLTQQFGAKCAINAPRVDVIPLGVNTERLISRDKLIARGILDLPANELILLYLGRLTEEHKADLEPLLIVFRELRRKYQSVTLLFAGSDQEQDYHRELGLMAMRLGVRDQVRFLPNFQDFLKPIIYSASDILISPVDNIQETFGISIVEAMACGLPVVASDWSGYRELVEHGRTGFLIPTTWNPSAADRVSARAPFLTDSVRRHQLAQQTVVSPRAMYDSLERLIVNAELRREFGAAGRAKAVSEFDWKRIVGMHEELWKDLWEILDSMPAEPGVRFADDWNRIFHHFATECVEPGLTVKRSALRSDLIAAFQRKGGQPGYADLDVDELQRILEKTSVFPLAIHELVEQGTGSIDSVVWLLKKGYLRVVETMGERDPSA